jgi:hypothetical protein
VKSILAILIILLVISCLWLMQSPKTYFSHPAMTQQERQMVKKAIREHGDYLITRETYDGRYIMHREGERIVL